MHVRIFARMHRHEWEGAHILNIWSADESLNPSDSTHDDTIIRMVVATLDVIIERATLGTILYRKKSFLIMRRFSTLLHNVWSTT